jgi:UDP-N-acetylmuramate--alanine ligase
MGIPYPEIAEGLAAFVGTGRRFERLGETDDGIAVIDDYAHHPTEIRATLAAARQAFPGRRIIAVFQPHLPSRTRDLMDDFATAFVDADLAVLTDIYLAREAADPAVTGEVLALRVGASLGADRTTYVADKHNLPDALKRIAWPKDVILTLGAGDIREAGERFLRNG